MRIIAQKLGRFSGFVVAIAAFSVQATEFNLLQTDKSTMFFVYRQMNVPLEGRFKRFNGKLNFDPTKPALAKAEINIELASIDTGSDEANDEVAGKLWFNTKVFPTVQFVTSSIKPLGNNRFEVAGKMSIKGRTREVTTQAMFHQEGRHAVLDGSFVLQRGDYGIGEGLWADFNTVANEVLIKFRLVAASSTRPNN